MYSQLSSGSMNISFQESWTYQLVVTVVMKNCEPLVSEPAFAIDNSPGIITQEAVLHA